MMSSAAAAEFRTTRKLTTFKSVLLTALFVVVGVGLHIALGFPTGSFPFTTFYIPIAAAAWIGGFRSGVWATFLAAVVGWFVFLQPASHEPLLFEQLEAIAIFLATGLFISAVIKQAQIKRPDSVPHEVIWK